jgi:hypothetical protein
MVLFIVSISQLFVKCFYKFFTKFSAQMSSNVPAVYDVLASPIKETVGFQGLQKCGWRLAWEWSAAE